MEVFDGQFNALGGLGSRQAGRQAGRAEQWTRKPGLDARSVIRSKEK